MNHLRNIRILSLDVTNTLIRLKRSPAETYSNFAREFGFHDVNQKAIGDSFIGAFKKLEDDKPCYGFYGAGAKSWWTDLMRICYGKEVANNPKFPLLADRVFNYYATKDAWCLTDEKNLDQLRFLSSHGLKIAIISNFDHRLLSLLDAFGIAEFVDHVVISGNVGFQKPEPGIFNLVLKHFQVDDANLCLHIGDNYKKDFLAAKSVGMNALLLTPDTAGPIDKHPIIPPADCIRSISDLKFE